MPVLTVLGIAIGLLLVVIPEPSTTLLGVALIFLSLGFDEEAPT